MNTSKSLIRSAFRIAVLVSALAPFQAAIRVDQNEAIADFPKAIHFYITASSSTEIVSVELQFGTDALSCGESVTRAIPEDFTSGISIETDYEWNLSRSGPIPPGTVVWWRWQITDASGEVFTTPEKNLLFTDESQDWLDRESDSILLHWSEGSAAFAEDLLAAGEASMEDLSLLTGVEVETRIQAFIYASSEEMQSATLFAPAWSGGLAFGDHNTILVAIHPSSLEWGRRALAHELAHVMIGRYIFSCIADMPVWLNEGLAMVTEGSLESYYQDLLADAIKNDQLLSVRELGVIFSNEPSLASLGYAQSFSLVSFLKEEYGQELMLSLLDEFRDGVSEDRALEKVYGMDRDGLDRTWRASVGAATIQAASTAGPTPTRTPFPTLAPITGPEFQPTETAQVVAQDQAAHTEAQETPLMEKSEGNRGEGNSPSSVFVLGGGALVLLLAGWIILRRKKHE